MKGQKIFSQNTGERRAGVQRDRDTLEGTFRSICFARASSHGSMEVKTVREVRGHQRRALEARMYESVAKDACKLNSVPTTTCCVPPRVVLASPACAIVWDAAYGRSFTFVRAYPTHILRIAKL